jgi:hypothetical protein
MQPSARYFFFSRVVLLSLAMLLGGDTAAWATVLSKKKRREKTAHSPTRKHASKIQKNNLPLQIVTPATPDAKGPNPYPLKKPYTARASRNNRRKSIGAFGHASC